MVLDLPSLDIDVQAVDQIAVVVEDLESSMDRFGTFLGVGPWDVYHFAPPAMTNTTYHGDPASFTMDIGVANRGDPLLEIELIEPLSGPNIYADHLQEHGEGLHHIGCFGFEDPADIVEQLQTSGIHVIQSGKFHGTTFWYLDTREALNGVIFETADNVGENPGPDATYP